MKKIPTIFDRDWDGNRGVIDKLVVDYPFDEAIATEKLDGMNVRLTVRNHTLVRLEKRRNPSKIQKAKGITDPWYVDAFPQDPEDQYLWDAANNIDLAVLDVPDGEWSGEAMGVKIQGNPLNLRERTICLFSLMMAPKINKAPNTYEELKEWLPKCLSQFGAGYIEGIVWHHPTAGMVKIKTKDFK